MSLKGLGAQRSRLRLRNAPSPQPVCALTTSSWRRRSLRTCACCAGVAIRLPRPPRQGERIATPVCAPVRDDRASLCALRARLPVSLPPSPSAIHQLPQPLSFLFVLHLSYSHKYSRLYLSRTFIDSCRKYLYNRSVNPRSIRGQPWMARRTDRRRARERRKERGKNP